MSAPPSPPLHQAYPPTQIDEAELPSGRCRYILLNPEIKGHRCACVGFTLNRALPSVSCECGHLSCYHIKGAEQPTDKVQMDQLLQRIQLLEEQLDREKKGGLGSALRDVVNRLGDLEEQYEKSKEERGQESRGIYTQITRVWQSMDQAGKRQSSLESHLAAYDERLDENDNTIEKLRERVMKTDDEVIDLEERVDQLEDLDGLGTPVGRQRRVLSSDTVVSRNLPRMTSRRRRLNEGELAGSMWIAHAARGFASSTGSGESSPISSPWTVHVSLMPMMSVAFPFEKDTNAYKRCLSRGLHRMIAVPGTDSESFVRAVSEAFGSLLKSRPWVPLQARLCDAETLLGLPMLRPLDQTLIGNQNYDMEFLRTHCAVCGPNGKLDSLYIAMESDTFSWHFLKRSPCYLTGLEDSWLYDPLLDHNDPLDGDDSMDEEDRPSAGDILQPLPGPSLKRTASEISKTPSFGSGSVAEDEGSRKAAKTGPCIPVSLELRRRLETV